MLNRLLLQDLVITRSRQKKSFRIIEDAEDIGNRVAGRKYDVRESYIRDWRKKTKCDLQRRIVIVGHFTAKSEASGA